MKIFLNIISVLIVIIIGIFAKLNLDTVTSIKLFGIKSHETFMYDTNLLIVAVIFFAFGLIIGGALVFSNMLVHKKRLKEYQRKLERTSVQSDEESSKVSVLEAKIETLEKALDEALNKEE